MSSIHKRSKQSLVKKSPVKKTKRVTMKKTKRATIKKKRTTKKKTLKKSIKSTKRSRIHGDGNATIYGCDSQLERILDDGYGRDNWYCDKGYLYYNITSPNTMGKTELKKALYWLEEIED